MTAYELMIETNRRLIAGEAISEDEKTIIVKQLLSFADTPKKPAQFGIEPNNKARAPMFFKYPHNDGKKLKTVLGQTPKTYILSGNMYELEILRLLCLFAPENTVVSYMADHTLKRLKATCFGFHGCYLGECFDSSLVVLRFLTIAAPSEIEWMKKIIGIYANHATNKKRVKIVDKYFKLCIAELPFEINLCMENI